MTKRQERAAHNEERESYGWRGKETRDTGPINESYDPDEAQHQREARAIPKKK
jgi:hypothetical protein